jgi:hypothetical protein
MKGQTLLEQAAIVREKMMESAKPHVTNKVIFPGNEKCNHQLEISNEYFYIHATCGSGYKMIIDKLAHGKVETSFCRGCLRKVETTYNISVNAKLHKYYSDLIVQTEDYRLIEYFFKVNKHSADDPNDMGLVGKHRGCAVCTD